MSRGNPSKRIQKPINTVTRKAILIRSGALLAIVLLLAVAGGMLAGSLSQRGAQASVPLQIGTNPSLNPLEATYLGVYLASNQAALNGPASADSTLIAFQVKTGETAVDITTKLASAGLITDETLFRNYLRYHGLDTQLEAGSYQLSASMTIPEIAVALTKAVPAEIVLQIPEGWRREQIADWLDQQPNLPFKGADFLAVTGAGMAFAPGSDLATDIPPGATLEGFLFPDTYRLDLKASALDLVTKMLTTFHTQVTPQMRADAAARGLTFYQVVTLAAIVEREAMIADERPVIASVYLNRLTAGMKLEADPTVQYAMGYQQATGQWWNLALTQEDYQTADSPYNTYQNEGLPPGPIANPGVASIQAVIYAQNTPYIYFRARCDGSGRHAFAVTFAEHVNNACP